MKGHVVKAGRIKTGLRFFTLLAIAATLSRGFIGPEFVKGHLTASTVKGRIELINSRIKPRAGRIDTSGAVVWVTSLESATFHNGAKRRAAINQQNKRFYPHIVAVETGSQVDFPNADPFFHNVFSIFNGKKFDLGLYASGETRPVNFNRPGISYIFCNIHPQMSAIVVALNTPYFAVTDQNGNFAIASVPEGRYQLGVWHERAKTESLDGLGRNLQVNAAGVDLGVIQISEEGYLPRPHPNKHGQEYDTQQKRPGYRKP